MGKSLIRGNRERKEGTEWSKVLSYASMGMSMVRGREGNGINGKTSQIRIATWVEYFIVCLLFIRYQRRRRFISQGDIKPGGLWLSGKKVGMTLYRLRCLRLAGQRVEVCKRPSQGRVLGSSERPGHHRL